MKARSMGGLIRTVLPVPDITIEGLHDQHARLVYLYIVCFEECWTYLPSPSYMY